MQKIFIVKIFRGPPSDRKKISGPPFLPWKLRVNPIEKHVNSIFNGKSVVIFFSGLPLTRVKTFKGPLFCFRPSLQVFVNGPLPWSEETLLHQMKWLKQLLTHLSVKYKLNWTYQEKLLSKAFLSHNSIYWKNSLVCFTYFSVSSFQRYRFVSVKLLLTCWFTLHWKCPREGVLKFIFWQGCAAQGLKHLLISKDFSPSKNG